MSKLSNQGIKKSSSKLSENFDQLLDDKSLLVRYCRFLLCYCSLLSLTPIRRFDFHLMSQIRRNNEAQITANNISLTDNSFSASSQTTRRNLFRILIQVLVSCLYSYTLIKIIITMYYMYLWNFSSLRYQSLNETLSGIHLHSNLNNKPFRIEQRKEHLGYNNKCIAQFNTSRMASELEQTRNSSWQILKFLGCPYVHYGFMAANFYMTFSYLSIMIYIVTLVVFRFHSRFDDIFLVKILIDRAGEMRKCRLLVLRELKSIELSSENFVIANANVCLSSVSSPLSRSRLSPELREILLGTSQDAGFRGLINEHRTTVKILNKLRQDIDALLPINRSRSWIKRSARTFALICTIDIVYNYAGDFDKYILYHFRNNHKLELDFRDKLALCEVLTHLFILKSSSIYLSMFYAALHNQLRYSNWLRNTTDRYLKYLIDKGQKVLINVEVGSAVVDSGEILKMNEVILLALLRYKILVAQLRRAKVLFSLVGSIQLIIILVSPILNRLHQPYWPEAFKKKTFFFFEIFILTSTIYIPMCRLHFNGYLISQQLSKMLAQTIYINRQSTELVHKHVYFEHSIMLLRKTLSYAQELGDNFGIKTLFWYMTYANFVRFYYWFIVLVLSRFREIESWRKIFGYRLDDPLGVFPKSCSSYQKTSRLRPGWSQDRLNRKQSIVQLLWDDI